MGALRLLALASLMALSMAFAARAATITALTLSNTTYTSSTKGTVVGDLVLSGANNSATTFALSGPDAARFQLSSPCTGASCSLEASGAEPDGYHDGKFLVFITPTLAGAKGSGVVYPFTVNETVACNWTVASGGTETQIADAIRAASAGQNVCFADGGTFTISSFVSVNKPIRLTGVNAKTCPSINVSNGVVAFNISANNAVIDHLCGIGPHDDPGRETDSCGLSNFIISSGTTSGLNIRYNRATGFHCTYTLEYASNSTFAWNEADDYDYVAFVCDGCNTVMVSDNLSQNGRPTTSEVNEYPFVISGDGVSTAVTFTNNVAIYSPIWEGLDNHGGTDIRFLNNYVLSANGNAAINSSGQTQTIQEIRPRIEGNVVDAGNVSPSSLPDSIVEVAASGSTMDCTGGDLQGCTVLNNTTRFGAADASCGYIVTGADGGRLVTGTGSQVQWVSGNSCGGDPATMAAPVLTTDQPSNRFVAGQSNGVIGKITVTVTPPFPSYVGGWPNYGGWPGTFSLGGPDAARFQICVDGQHLCQAAGGTGPGSYNITIRGTLNGLSNSPQTSGTITLTGS
jgi:hypothetical protein